MVNSVVLDSDKYESFFAVLSMIKDDCSDIIVNNGIVRQKNDTEVIFYEFDLTDVLGNISAPFTTVKSRIDLLKMFVGSDEVSIEADDEKYSIKDEFSKLTFTIPALQFITNKFEDKDSLVQMFNFDNRKLVFQYTFSQKLCERMRVITNSYNIRSFAIEFNGESATIKARPDSNDQTAVIVSDIPLDTVIEGKMCNIITTLMILDHDGDLYYELYIDNDNILVSMLTTTIKGVNCTLHNRCRIMDID